MPNLTKTSLTMYSIEEVSNTCVKTPNMLCKHNERFKLCNEENIARFGCCSKCLSNLIRPNSEGNLAGEIKCYKCGTINTF